MSCLDRQEAPPGARRRFQGKTDKGIGIGAGRADVVAAYGPPDAVAAGAGPTDQATLAYRTLGLSFGLVRDKVSQITLEVPRLEPKALIPGTGVRPGT